MAGCFVLAPFLGCHLNCPQIASIQAMRVQVSLQYIALRNERHRKMRQTLAALWQQQQQQHEQQMMHSRAAAGPVPTRTASSPQQVPSIGSQSHHGPDAAPAKLGRSAEAGGIADTKELDGEAAAAKHPTSSLQHVLSIVQYMAFVHALRRFTDRAIAVARAAADAEV